MKNYLTIFMTALKLGLTSFGGPTAHLGYFQKEYVQKRKWLSNEQYTDLVALAQFLPGPASSQVGIGIGLLRGGIVGSLLAFIGFTLPSVIILMVFALFLVGTSIDLGFIQGLKLVAVAIVAQALLDMSKKLLPTAKHVLLAIAALSALLLFQASWLQIVVIIVAAIIGQFIFTQTASTQQTFTFSKKIGTLCLSAFVILLIALPLVARFTNNAWLLLFEKFYTAGAFVFGGGHVVLPLLETQFVTTGLLSSADFLAGYGLTQAVPGPLFTFAAYIGTLTNGIAGGIVATIAIFLPAFLLIIGALPFWQLLSANPKLRGAVVGMNAAVVGILGAAFISPIITHTVTSVKDVAVLLVLVAIVFFAKQPPWVTVVSGLLLGLLFYR
ncbi:MAG TPA: chromate efflux transporter [Metalysinibacillus jejuensis]|uniref:Chromate efflux transporter n=1 Tax=Metalysinibacillus jejuensis TaxID=914327 RepID=A0A921NBV8_9BACL|nr:chromate efflux transporter [Metalysinibacillus jejuensis]